MKSFDLSRLIENETIFYDDMWKNWLDVKEPSRKKKC